MKRGLKGGTSGETMQSPPLVEEPSPMKRGLKGTNDNGSIVTASGLKSLPR